MQQVHLKKVKARKKFVEMTRAGADRKKRRAITIRSIIISLIIAPLFLWVLYQLATALTTSPAEVAIYYHHDESRVFQRGSIKEINRILARDREVQIKIVITAKPDYYRSLDGHFTLPRDMMKIQLEDSSHNIIEETTITLKPDPDEPEKWRGEASVNINPNNKNLQLSEFIRLTRTNQTETASLLPLRMPIEKLSKSGDKNEKTD